MLALAGPLDSGALRQATHALIERHGSLRAGFEQGNLARPVQVISAGLTPSWRSIDLALRDEGERAALLSELLVQDRALRFDVSSPPLLRFTLIRFGPQDYRLVLTLHHLLLDGWSAAILVQELLALYGNGGEVAALPDVRPYRDYLAWVAAQDHTAALAAWREALAGVREPTRVARHGGTAAGAQPEQLMMALSAPLTAAMSEQARRAGVTVNTIVQAAWAILLGRLLGRDDVVFGVTVAGRPPELAGIERMVGLFINTLPLRVKLAPEKPLLALLREVQDEQSKLIAHQHVGLSEI